MLLLPARSTLFPYTTLFRSVDSMGIKTAGIFGDILCERIKRRGVAALVTDGVMRDVAGVRATRSEEHTSELQSPMYLVCRLLLEKKKNDRITIYDRRRDISQ